MKKIAIAFLLLLILIVAGCASETEETVKSDDLKGKNETEVATNIDKEFTEKWKDSNQVFLDKRPTIGDEKAPVTIIEFGDYKCPYCGQWEEEVYPWLKEEYIDTGKVKLVFMNFPFIGPDSNTAAYAGESIYLQNPESFWKYYELMYQNQGSEQEQWATKEYILELVKDLEGIDLDKLEQDIDEEYGKDMVLEDRKYAMENNVSSTPTLIMNGYAIENAFDKETISGFIEEYLQND